MHNLSNVGHEPQPKDEEKDQTNDRRSPKGAPLLKGVFQGPGITKRSQKLLAGKKHLKKTMASTSSGGRGRGHGTKHSSSPSRSESSGSSGEASGSESGKDTPVRSPSPDDIIPVVDFVSRGSRWDSRRRDSRINGADLYVARITKNGCGNARPCWRCLEWCKWAGIKRIFHWNEDANQFEVVKVNSASPDQYETHADNRLFAGLVSLISRSTIHLR